MSKKSFKKNNPALDFISAPSLEKIESTRLPNESFQEAIQKTDFSILPEKKKPKPKKETKSKRLNLLIQPSLHETLSKIAYVEQRSVNNLIVSVMQEYAEKNEEKITQYHTLF